MTDNKATVARDAIAALEALTAENAGLRAALQKYGLHGIDCAIADPEEDKHVKCTCGFDAALSSPSSSRWQAERRVIEEALKLVEYFDLDLFPIARALADALADLPAADTSMLIRLTPKGARYGH